MRGDGNDARPHAICWNLCSRRNISGTLFERPPLEERYRSSSGAGATAVGNMAMSAYVRLGRLSKIRFVDKMTSGLSRCRGCQIDLGLSFRRRSNHQLSFLVHCTQGPYQQLVPNPPPCTPDGKKWTRTPKSWTGVTRKMTTRHTTLADPVKISVNLATTLTRIVMTPCLWAGTRMTSASCTLTSLVPIRRSPNLLKFLVTATATTIGSLHTVALGNPLISLLHIHLTCTRN